jgi:hypothetical protein
VRVVSVGAAADKPEAKQRKRSVIKQNCMVIIVDENEELRYILNKT